MMQYRFLGDISFFFSGVIDFCDFLSLLLGEETRNKKDKDTFGK